MREIVDDRIGQKSIQTLLYGLQIVLISRAAPGGGHFFYNLFFRGISMGSKEPSVALIMRLKFEPPKMAFVFFMLHPSYFLSYRVEILIRFRRWPIEVTGDIKKAFLQLEVK